MSAIRVALVDDHRVVTRSLTAWLESFPDLCVVGAAASGEELLNVLDDWKPDVVIQDLLLPGGIDGIETTKRIRARRGTVKVLALTASIDEPRMMGVLRAGASGYLRKDAEPETLVAAVRAIAAGKTYLDPMVASVVRRGALPHESLTPREREVLRHIALGRSNREIGSALGIGEETVKSHVAHVLDKLAVENRAQAIVEAFRRRLVEPEELQH
jgi:DNA-binding NarL/FixJ family response regulator